MSLILDYLRRLRGSVVIHAFHPPANTGDMAPRPHETRQLLKQKIAARLHRAPDARTAGSPLITAVD